MTAIWTFLVRPYRAVGQSCADVVVMERTEGDKKPEPVAMMDIDTFWSGEKDSPEWIIWERLRNGLAVEIEMRVTNV